MRDLAFYILENDSGAPAPKQLYFYRAGQNLEEIPKECTAISEALRLSLDTNELERLPESFYAPKLVSLLLGGNPIVSLPASFLSNFPKLRVLDLTHREFYRLPEELGDLKDLVCLELSHCDNVHSLPDAVGKLHVLRFPGLCACGMLNYVPSGVVGLTSLQVLSINGCYNLTWAEHTASHMARAESLGDVYPTVGASLEDICGLVVLTELSNSGKSDPGVELPHNISAPTKLKVLQLDLNLKSVPAEIPYWFTQLQELDLWDFESLEYLPGSFTCCGAFPALIKFRLCCFSRLVQFPEVDEGGLPELRTLDFSGCDSLGTLRLSLEVPTSLKKLILLDCQHTLKDSCRNIL